jgi:uncharacterized membrane protein
MQRARAHTLERHSTPAACGPSVPEPPLKARRQRWPRAAERASFATAALLAAGAWTLLAAAPAEASIGEALAKTLTGWAPAWLVVVLLAATPVVELRGAIPLGVAVLGFHPATALGLAIVGNMLPVPLILASLGPLTRAAASMPRARRVVDTLLRRAQGYAESWGEENTFWALALFVGVPLPGTGAWTGAMASWVLGMPFVDSCAANFAGVCIAGVLVTALTCMGWAGLWTAVVAMMTIPIITWLIKSMSSER